MRESLNEWLTLHQSEARATFGVGGAVATLQSQEMGWRSRFHIPGAWVPSGAEPVSFCFLFPQRRGCPQTIIRNRICKCQYKVDDSLSPEAKDLVSQCRSRGPTMMMLLYHPHSLTPTLLCPPYSTPLQIRRMLKLDPNERASMPEITTHVWLRFRHGAFESSHNGPGVGVRPGQVHHAEGGASAHDRASADGSTPGPPGLVITPVRVSTSPTPTSASTPLGAGGGRGPKPPPPLSPGLGPEWPVRDPLIQPQGRISPIHREGRLSFVHPAPLNPPSPSNVARAPREAVPIMFDMPLLTSPLHSRQHKDTPAYVSFLDAPSAEKGAEKLGDLEVMAEEAKGRLSPPPGLGEGSSRPLGRLGTANKAQSMTSLMRADILLASEAGRDRGDKVGEGRRISGRVVVSKWQLRD